MESSGNCSDNIGSRRSFLKRIAKLGTGAFAFPYVVNASALGKGAAPPASERITIAAIGVGSKGYRDTRSLLGDRRVQYVAVCDVDRSCRKKTQNLVNTSYRKHIPSQGCNDYADFREIIARKDIDAVNIATPDHWHAIIATQAAKAGKDIYCQKPLALTLELGRKMANTVKRYGVIFQTGLQLRSDERFRRACELVRNGRLGKIHSVEVELPGGKCIDGFYSDPVPRGFDYDMWLGPAPKAEFSYKRIDRLGWRFISDYAGGVITDRGSHSADVVQWALGTTLTGPIEIEGKGVFPEKGMFDTAVTWKYDCLYENGVQLTCFAKFERKPTDVKLPEEIKFIGDKGWLCVSPDKMESEPKSILKEEISPNEIHLYKSTNHYSNFVDCMISRQSPAAPVEEAHRSVSICHLANIAMRTESKIKWDPDKEQIIGNQPASKMLSRPMRQPWHL